MKRTSRNTLGRTNGRSRHGRVWCVEQCADEPINVSGAQLLDNLQGPCIFVANHQSHLDTLVVHQVLPESIKSKLYFGAAQDRWFVKGKKKIQLKPWYQSLVLGNFPILRGGGTRALSYANWLLNRGQHVFLFPEGTRATNEALGEFKHGATILARNNGLQIVPIYLSGLRAIRPKGSRSVLRGEVGVEFLQPLQALDFENVAAATAELHNRMNEAHTRHSVKEVSLNQAA
ncbi:MAG: lysophospholipid acyltransferase family protein [Proteobacteria bacterium]|nr:lysophospholipid acyltransferase family protein [Pseudomonadota bacterium]